MPGVVFLKDGVKLDGLRPAGVRILSAIDNCARVLGLDLTVTCGLEAHGATDPHTLGNAIDLRASAFSAETIVKIKSFLEASLGTQFTVLYECAVKPEDPNLARVAYVNPHATAPHYHIQPVKGSVWPPEAAHV